jgi:anthranilate phosphoribosyltransferase
VRKKLGIRTIFNLVAPLANPAMPEIQVVGTPSLNVARILERAIREIGLKGYAIVTGYPGMDEVSPSGASHILVNRDGYREMVISPGDLGIREIPLQEVSGRTRDEIFDKGVKGLRGEDRSSAIFIAMNAGLALYIAGATSTLTEGFERSLKEILSGKAWKKLGSIISTSRRLAGLGSS